MSRISLQSLLNDDQPESIFPSLKIRSEERKNKKKNPAVRRPWDPAPLFTLRCAVLTNMYISHCLLSSEVLLFPKGEVRPSPQPINQLVAEHPTWSEYLGVIGMFQLCVFTLLFCSTGYKQHNYIAFNVLFSSFIISLAAKAEPLSAYYTKSAIYGCN